MKRWPFDDDDPPAESEPGNSGRSGGFISEKIMRNLRQRQREIKPTSLKPRDITRAISVGFESTMSKHDDKK